MEKVAIIADLSGTGANFARGVYGYVRGFISDCVLIDIKKTTFKDKEFKLKIADNIRRRKCFLIHDSNKEPCEWFTELVFILEAMRFSSPEEINVIFPYMRFARQERKDESRISVNAKALADVLSIYANRGMTVDLHAGQIQEYFNFPFDNLYSFPVLIKHLKDKHPDFLEDLVVVSPDLGGGKRAEALAKKFVSMGIKAGLALGYKSREKDNEVSKMNIIGDIEGKNCLIIDDIIDTGNTLVKTGEILKEKGAKMVYAFGTHGLFTDGTDKFRVFDKVLVSDSLSSKLPENSEVVSLVTLFGEAIYRTIMGESLSVLFG